ncbi:uncharacterized protein [Bombus flavifrons]|uniref:uncharacterized protein isoform X2 n=1 Tax=Bombus flavifrons TaxID=103934 RepID=UPI003703E07A
MEMKCVVFMYFTLLPLLLLTTEVYLHGFKGEVTTDDTSLRGCTYLHCGGDDVCVHRKFRCKDPPCPSMLYCARSRTESLRGPSNCDTVHCTNGYVCMLKVRRCHWDEKCEQQIARCVTQKEYYEGPASCAGFKCPQGNHCILRESFCANPPCKLIKSCMKNKEVQHLFVKCRNLGCSSEYECFLRRPEGNCSIPLCKHTPDCIMPRENEMANERCRGWICPQRQTCSAEIVGSCETDDCNIKRTCHEVHVTAANDSVSSFSRRSLKKEDEVPRNDSEIPTNSDQENGVERRGIPVSWLNHLKSKTELEAIELWRKNVEEEEDFKQFQDWLQSIKEILGSGAYGDWLEEILSSRGKELRKWLQASHGNLDAMGPTLPGQERPTTLTENLYSVRGTMNMSPSDDKKGIEEIESFLRERNLTHILEKILVPSRILLPPYAALEAALLNNVRESSPSPFFNYLLKYPSYVGNQFLSSRPQKIENAYDQQYLVVPVKNMKELTNSPIIDYNPSIRHHHGTISENGKVSDVRDNFSTFNVPEKQMNLSSTRDELSSLWTGLHKNLEKTSPKEETHSVEDSIDLSEDKRLMAKAQHFDDIPVDLLEKFLKFLNSMQFSPIENVSQTFDEKPIEEYREEDLPKAPRNEKHDGDFEWSSIIHSENNEDTFRNKNAEENANQFSFPNDDYGNFTDMIEPGVKTFFNKLDNIQPFSYSDQSNDVQSQLSFPQIDDINNEEMNLNLFLELNRESLLPYVQTLMEMMNEENDTFDRETELNFDESSLNTSFLNSEQVIVDETNKYYNESKSSGIESSNIFLKNVLNNVNDVHNSHILEEETYDQILPTNQTETASSNLKP